jgi:hypothetical protein
MALTTAQQVRVKIQDQPLLADTTLYFDGMASSFTLPHSNITSGSAMVLDAGGQWSATGATFNASGMVAVPTALPASTGLRVTYVHSTFSDDEISHFTAVGGNVLGAAIEACEALMFDGLKRARWASPDGTQYDDTMAMNTVVKIYETLKAEQADDATLGGAVNSWSMLQGDYN